MRRLPSLTFPLGLIMVLSACTDPMPLSQTGDGPAIETDRGSYRVETANGELQVDIPWQFTNPTDSTVYVVNCNGIARPVLERSLDGSWELAYAPAVPQCLSPPITIAPGETYRDTLAVRAGLPDGQMHPTWEGPIEGTYRLQWNPLSSYDEDAQGFGEPLPLEQRISNDFQLEPAS